MTKPKDPAQVKIPAQSLETDHPVPDTVAQQDETTLKTAGQR
jgi:hypothetical protein